MVQILLARLESNKSFDWYDLSLQLNHGKAATKHRKKGGKKWKEEGEEEGALTGDELRNVYNEVGSQCLNSIMKHGKIKLCPVRLTTGHTPFSAARMYAMGRHRL